MPEGDPGLPKIQETIATHVLRISIGVAATKGARARRSTAPRWSLRLEYTPNRMLGRTTPASVDGRSR
jgi:hypothetical protein